MFRNFNALVITSIFLSTNALAVLPEWSYDPGPNPQEENGKELIDLVANIPNMPEISNQLFGRKQKFRPAFGPIPWRMLQEKNKVKILFMGQDGTHIAEAAGRPATAGFGGRAQDFANFFGVNEGAAFINAYAFTIKGQYGVYNTPFFFDFEGEKHVGFSNYVENKLWAISNDLESPIVQWRNDLIDWIIKNNKESMKLIVLFGGAARDAVATYAQSKGAIVEPRAIYTKIKKNDDGSLVPIKVDEKSIQVPVIKEEYAGGNNTFPSLVSKDGKDLYELTLKRPLTYKNSKDQKAVVESLKENVLKYFNEVKLTQGGHDKNGVITLAQLSGYDLDEMTIKGVKTRSLKGLKLNDGSVIENDILVVELPHPSSLSRTVMEADSYSKGKELASQRVMKKVQVLKKYAQNGWEIKADPGKINHFARGENYKYGRSDIGPEFYDFGTPANRMVSKSTARRMSGNANVVIIGTRENGNFDKKKISNMTLAKAAFGINKDDLYISRPSNFEQRYSFDRGPGQTLAKIMKSHLNLPILSKAKTLVECIKDEANVIFKKAFILELSAKNFSCPNETQKNIREMTFYKEERGRVVKDSRGNPYAADGIDAFVIKSHPSVKDFGHYRGKVQNAKVIILADPHGYDDIVTSKALTGTRGQYIQGAMNDLGIYDDYLVIKTVPFAMENATDEEYAYVIEQTKEYRTKIFEELKLNNEPIAFIADGKYAQKELARLVPSAKIISMNRAQSSYDYGIKNAMSKLALILNRNTTALKGKMANIPRSHLSFYARTWEGTSGDRVITSKGKKFKGIAFAEVVPSWAYKQKKALSQLWFSQTIKLKDQLKELGL